MEAADRRLAEQGDVQRVPVKLVMDDLPSDVVLGPGMSVVPTVRVDPASSLLERLEAWL